MDYTLFYTILGVIAACLIGLVSIKNRSVKKILISILVICGVGITILLVQGMRKTIPAVIEWVEGLRIPEPSVEPTPQKSSWQTSSLVMDSDGEWSETAAFTSGSTAFFLIRYTCYGDDQDVTMYEDLANGLEFTDDYYVVMGLDEDLNPDVGEDYYLDGKTYKAVDGSLFDGFHFKAKTGDVVTVLYRVNVTGSVGDIIYNAVRTVTDTGTQHDQCRIEIEN